MPSSLRALLTLGLLLCAGLAGAADAPPANLVRNGGFSTDADRDGSPDGWGKSAGAGIQRTAEGTWLRLTGSASGLSQQIRLDPAWHKLKLTMRLRATGVVVGDAGWKDARLAMTFADGAGKRVGDWPQVFNASGTTGWIACERTYVIPTGAATLTLAPANFGSAGTAEFADVVLTIAQVRSAKADLPPLAGLESPWDPSAAASAATATRGRICVNGLWRFIPVLGGEPAQVPAAGEGWGWFKVPGMWPGGSDWDVGAPAQSVHLSPWIEQAGVDLGTMEQAWYRRDIAVPAGWAGRRVALEFTMLQTHARVFLDGRPAGECWFPGGQVDVTAAVAPGTTQSLALLVTARPLEAESKVFMAPDRVLSNKTRLKMKGITGDVFLVAGPQQDALGDVQVRTSTRRGEITFDVGFAPAPRSPGPLLLTAVVSERGAPVKTFTSAPFTAAALKDGRFAFTAPWPDAKRWDTDTPGNIYQAAVELRTADGRLLDAALPESFGFREFWTAGRDLMLNGTPVHLRALFTANICDYADRACLDGSLNLCARAAEYGFNFLITSNYGFSPGQVGYMDGLYAACDRSGMLVSCSLPHVNEFNWLKTPADRQRYRELTEWVVRRVQNHPSIVTYAMSHNATGYYGDQNPLKIDGRYDPATITDPASPVDAGFLQRRAQAEQAAAIAKACDPSRPVYHHQSGNLGDLYTINTYLNWAPLQERSDWFAHWAESGVKPLFLVEWGLPHIASWSSFRGPEFIWRSEALQQIWDSEFAAAWIGEQAYAMGPAKVELTRAEERLWAAGKPFHFGRLTEPLRQCAPTYTAIQALFAADNWRSHRGWGVSAMLPWDQEALWDRVAATPARPFPGRDTGLQSPGVVPDELTPGRQFIYESDPAAFAPSPLGAAFRRWNQPLLAFIGGGEAEGFTGKAHNCAPGASVAKQLVLINDGRRERSCAWRLTTSFGAPAAAGTALVPAGGRVLVPVSFTVPAEAKAGELTLTASFDFGDGAPQQDRFALHVIPPPAALALDSAVELYDPKGLTAPLLDALGVRYTRLAGGAPGPGCGILVIGREALADPAATLDLGRVAGGLRVLVFEQGHETLLHRFGLRGNLLGVRNLFARTPSHPVLAGLPAGSLRDWRGAATLTPPNFATEAFETRDPRWSWCGFESTRVWRAGNRGNVASVLIEKPARGDWLPLLDCAFDLQYSPLLEHRAGDGVIVFCQLDVSGRTQADPAATAICRNLFAHLDRWAPARRRTVAYAGGAAGAELLRTLGVASAPAGEPAGTLLVLGHGSQPAPAGLLRAVEDGLNVLALGLDAAELTALLPELKTRPTTQASELAECLALPEFAGVSNADLHWRTVLPFTALDGIEPGRGGAALAVVARGKGRIVLCQAAPWMFDYAAKPYLRTTYRRNAFLVARLLANLGAGAEAGMAARFARREPQYKLTLATGWRGEPDRTQVGREQGWWKSAFADAAWAPIQVPGLFDVLRKDLDGYDGAFWYRHRFTIPAGMDLADTTLWIGAVDDESWVWLNDEFLGEVSKATNPKDYWQAPRSYKLRPGLLRKDGENVLVIRANDLFRNGGLASTPELRQRFPWLDGPCLQEPVADDNPYRYYRW